MTDHDFATTENLTGVGTSTQCVEVLLTLAKTSPANLDRDLGHLKASLAGRKTSPNVVGQAIEITRCEAVIRDLLEEIWQSYGQSHLWFTTREQATSIDYASVISEQLLAGFGTARRAGVRLGALLDTHDAMTGTDRERRPWAAG